MEPIAVFNTENVTDDEASSFRHRRAVRAIVFDNNKDIALLHAPAGYFGLPGGGVDEGENWRDGIVRECREEIGCSIDITQELGRTLEYRKRDNLLNESYGFIGTVTGEKGEPQFLGDENDMERGSVVQWMSLTDAIDVMEQTPKQDNLYSQYCVERDLAFLKRARELL